MITNLKITETIRVEDSEIQPGEFVMDDQGNLFVRTESDGILHAYLCVYLANPASVADAECKPGDFISKKSLPKTLFQVVLDVTATIVSEELD